MGSSKRNLFMMIAAIVAVACVVTWQHVSASASTPGPVVAIVNIQDAILATNEGKQEFGKLQTQFAPKQNQLKTQSDEVDRLKKELQQGTLSAAEKSARGKDLAAKQKALQRNFEESQAEYQKASEEVVNRLGQKMLNVMEKYAKANGISVVLDVSTPQTPVLYASQEANITKQVVDAYNAQQK